MIQYIVSCMLGAKPWHEIQAAGVGSMILDDR